VSAGPACGEGAADPRTGVHALVPHTRLVCRTLWVDGALRLALDVGVALQTGETGAGSCSLSFPAFCIDTTWGRTTGVDNLRARTGGCREKRLSKMIGNIGAWLTCDKCTLGEGISLVALVADTDGDMVPNSAVGIDATEARTGISAVS
jgi:hypothetical protein